MKLALVSVAMLMFAGAWAQNPPAAYEDITTDALAPSISYVTTGKTMPFYVMPDLYYHPNYVAAGTLTAGFTWTWSITGAATLQNQANNYVEVVVPGGLLVETDYTIDVFETAAATHGGCPDATPTTATVRGVPAPAMGAVNYPYFNTTLAIADGGTYSVCGNMAAADVTVQLSGYPNFQLKWTLTQVQIDAAGVDVGLPTTIVDNSAGQTLGAGNSLTRVTDQNYILHNYAHTMLVPVADPVRTKYVYTLGGITDLISRKSDFLAATGWYANVDQVYTIIINPAPQTGPIYHIPNDYGAL